GRPAAKDHNLEVPLPQRPKQDEAEWTESGTRLMDVDSDNEMRLAEIERDHDARTTSNAYFRAGVLEMQRGDARKARGYLEWALRATPDQVTLLQWHAIALATQGRYPDAAYELEHASTLQPD